MPARLDITGKRFGRLTALGLSHAGRGDPSQKNRDAFWACRCDCGNEVAVRGVNLIYRKTSSCGCLATKHGHSSQKRSPTYVSWENMKARCLNPKHPGFANWGGRGITICERWLASFLNFLEDMGERPPGMTLDRIDNDGNYEPRNCRWGTRKQQRDNQRANVNAKLTRECATALRQEAAWLGGHMEPSERKELALKFGVSVRHMRDIASNRAWTTEPPPQVANLSSLFFGEQL
jgi:hypothetical protein